MHLTFLSSSVPLTKKFVKNTTAIDKHPYPHVALFSSHQEVVKSMSMFAKTLQSHAAQGHCLLKGNTSKTLANESRAGSTDPIEQMDWICLDLDGLDGSLTDVLASIGLDEVDYVVQYSASYLITSKDLRCHVFMQLGSSISAPLLKQWLIGLNLETESVRSQIALTKSNNALKWPIDVSACQADKLLYIAPPELVGLTDPVAHRIAYVKKKHRVLDLDIARIPVQSANRKQQDKLIIELRDQAGLPAKKFTTREIDGKQVMTNPQVGKVSGMKTDRGFVYLNINGGDSWGYFHPADRPDYIYNFKDEPVYKTQDFLPEYWLTLTKKAEAAPTGGDCHRMAFLDVPTNTYYRAVYDQTTDVIKLEPAKNKEQIRDYAKQHGIALGDFVPEWHMINDPHDAAHVDFDRRIINMFERTQYMRSIPVPRDTPPPGILRVIHHALGGDEAITRHFIHWLAYVMQKKDRTLTAWVLHGVAGTGKGILFNRIITPLFGARQTTMRRMEEFDNGFNSYMENNLIVCVDEMEAQALFNARGVMAKLKNFITEERVSLRTLYRAAYDVYNRTNWLFFSNQAEVVHIPPDDRRFNVGVYQPKKLLMTQPEIDALRGELQHFYDFLMLYPTSRQEVQTPIDTDARNSMISISESSIDSVCNAVRNGDFDFLMDHLPTGDEYKVNAFEMNKVENYIAVLKKLMARSDADGSCSVMRDELRTILEYCVGSMPTSPNKFTSLVKHHRIHMGVVHNSDIQKAGRGIKVTWTKPEQFPEFIETLTPNRPALRAVK